MERKTGGLRFWAVTVILIIVTAFCCAGTVMSRTDLNGREMERYYREREQQLVEDAGEYLRLQGYVDSGVMLTRVVNTDGSREYTLSIHHGSLAGLDEEERKLLADGLREITFADQGCVFFIIL